MCVCVHKTHHDTLASENVLDSKKTRDIWGSADDSMEKKYVSFLESNTNQQLISGGNHHCPSVQCANDLRSYVCGSLCWAHVKSDILLPPM